MRGWGGGSAISYNFFTFLILNVEFWFILSGILCDFELHKNESRRVYAVTRPADAVSKSRQLDLLTGATQPTLNHGNNIPFYCVFLCYFPRWRWLL